MNKKNLFVFGFLAIVSLAIIIFLFSAVSSYNSMVTKQESVEEKWSQVLNVYQRRADLIPNLVEIVKGAADFEKSTLTEITDARSKIGQLNINENTFKDPKALEAFFQSQDKLSGSLGRLMMQVENYPQLRATQSFRDLQIQLEGSENRIATERRNFNQTVKDYNSFIRMFPRGLFAGMLGFEKVSYFEGEKGIEKAPKIKF